MYTYTCNCSGYTVYKNGVPVYKAERMNTKKRFNKRDLENNERSAQAHIRMLQATEAKQEQRPTSNIPWFDSFATNFVAHELGLNNKEGE